MRELRFTLLSDGSSDADLLPILRWLLQENDVQIAIQAEWADLRHFRTPRVGLSEQIQQALYLYPCDLLFVHRDGEQATRAERRQEIQKALAIANTRQNIPPAVCVIPIRMLEAWLLFDEMAIRHAAGNKNGRAVLNLPAMSQLESLPDPKQVLYTALRTASGLSPQRLRRFNVAQSSRRVVTFMDDFTPLRRLPAFVALEKEVRETIGQYRWGVGRDQ